MLARNVEQLGREKGSLGSSQLALVIGVMIVATQWNQLQVVPVFLGFLTYKAALLFYMLKITLMPHS
jgi:ATP synthase protein I